MMPLCPFAADRHVGCVCHDASDRLIQHCQAQVRPYTVRNGDTLASIAQKREVPLEQVLKLNHSTSPDALVEGQTLLLPTGKLSARDKEILEGIGPWTYRTYPVRAGETLNVSPALLAHKCPTLFRSYIRREVSAPGPTSPIPRAPARRWT